MSNGIIQLYGKVFKYYISYKGKNKESRMKRLSLSQKIWFTLPETYSHVLRLMYHTEHPRHASFPVPLFWKNAVV